MNRDWLLENAAVPIQYSLTQDTSLTGRLLDNEEVKVWLGRLTDRVIRGDLSKIHGSHDYRYENIIGKCFILGLNAKIPQFDLAIRFFIDFLDKQPKSGSAKYLFGEMEKHISHIYDEKLTFGKIYQYRDYETIIVCYMPFMGYSNEKSVQYLAHKRANIVYEFTRHGRYDVYRADLACPGVKKEWKPYILDPELYKDGNIALPSIHDLILFAGMYPHFDNDTNEKVETAVRWIFGEGYARIHNRLYYYAPDDPLYKSKAINNKVILLNVDNPRSGDMQSLLFDCFIFSHFREARKSEWFSKALAYLERYKTAAGRYIFPKEMITEQKDRYVYDGGHMNAGELKKNKDYAEIISTYWMEKILANLYR